HARRRPPGADADLPVGGVLVGLGFPAGAPRLLGGAGRDPGTAQRLRGRPAGPHRPGRRPGEPPPRPRTAGAAAPRGPDRHVRRLRAGGVMPHRPKRVAVTSPQTRLAHLRGRARGRWRVPRLDPDDAERAAALYLAQRRQGLLALILGVVTLVGLPLVLAAWPALDTIRLWTIPVSWLMLAVLPYPALTALSFWQLRQAERIERR